jgi:hypothetical protein
VIGPLRERAFLRLWIAGFVSEVGDWMLPVALPVFVYLPEREFAPGDGPAAKVSVSVRAGNIRAVRERVGVWGCGGAGRQFAKRYGQTFKNSGIPYRVASCRPGHFPHAESR